MIDQVLFQKTTPVIGVIGITHRINDSFPDGHLLEFQKSMNRSRF
jgi:hypothetical protein